MEQIEEWLRELRKRDAPEEEVANALRAQGYLEPDVVSILARYRSTHHPHPVRTTIIVLILLLIAGFGVNVLFGTEIDRAVTYVEARVAWSGYSDGSPILAEYRAGTPQTCAEWVRVVPHPDPDTVSEEEVLCLHAFAVRDKNPELCRFGDAYDGSCVTLVGYALGSATVCSNLPVQTRGTFSSTQCTSSVNDYIAVTQKRPDLCHDEVCRWFIGGSEATCAGNSICIAFFTGNATMCPTKGRSECVAAIALHADDELVCDELGFRARSCRAGLSIQERLCPECGETASEMPELEYEARLPLFESGSFYEYLALSKAVAASKQASDWLTPGFQ